MRNKQLIERDKKNIVIACFLGGSDSYGKSYSTYNLYDAQKLRFHYDWNWLMKAWERFRSYKLYDHEYMKHKHIIANHISFGTISEAFEALYEGVNWYNNLNN